MTLDEFIARENLVMTYKRVEKNPNPNMDGMPRGSSHWKCILRRRNARPSMVVHFSQGPALTKHPTIHDVLDCLATDALAAASSFTEWASEFGYDNDSRKAERTYKTVQRQSRALERVLGTQAYVTLLYDTERL